MQLIYAFRYMTSIKIFWNMKHFSQTFSNFNSQKAVEKQFN